MRNDHHMKKNSHCTDNKEKIIHYSFSEGQEKLAQNLDIFLMVLFKKLISYKPSFLKCKQTPIKNKVMASKCVQVEKLKFVWQFYWQRLQSHNLHWVNKLQLTYTWI